MTPRAESSQAGEGDSVSPRSGARAAALDAALEVLAADGCVGFPTETVWGLACRARSGAAVAGLQKWKGRPEGQPISVLVAGPSALAQNGFESSAEARKIMRAFWPGPLTLILPCRDLFARGVAREDGSIGVRCSSYPLAAELARRAEVEGLGPLTATSLNRSGEPPARKWEEARRLCGTDSATPFPLFVAGEDAHGGPPSTLLDLSVSRPRLLREGAVGRERLRPFFEQLAPERSGPPPRGDSGA